MPNCATRTKGLQNSLVWARFRVVPHAFCVFPVIFRDSGAPQSNLRFAIVPHWRPKTRLKTTTLDCITLASTRGLPKEHVLALERA